MNLAPDRLPRRRDEARALFRNAILDAAEAVFAERGFHGARIQDVAARARIAVGTVYNHFAQKDDVLAALLEERTEGLLAQMRDERRSRPRQLPRTARSAGGAHAVVCARASRVLRDRKRTRPLRRCGGAERPGAGREEPRTHGDVPRRLPRHRRRRGSPLAISSPSVATRSRAFSAAPCAPSCSRRLPKTEWTCESKPR